MASGRIKTKSVYDPIEDSDGVRILVTRYHPRIKGFKKGVGYDEWLKDLSPVGPAVKKFKAGKMPRGNLVSNTLHILPSLMKHEANLTISASY
jgi:uncharacterized protein YeaO (DUF488 family)